MMHLSVSMCLNYQNLFPWDMFNCKWILFKFRMFLTIFSSCLWKHTFICIRVNARITKGGHYFFKYFFSASLFLWLNLFIFSSSLFMMHHFLKSEIKVIDHVSNLLLSISVTFFIYAVLLFSSRIFIWLFLKFPFLTWYSSICLFIIFIFLNTFIKAAYIFFFFFFFANPQILGFSVTVSICHFLFFFPVTLPFFFIYFYYILNTVNNIIEALNFAFFPLKSVDLCSSRKFNYWLIILTLWSTAFSFC